MKMIIFEGIATSGKSTITDRLVKALPASLSVSIKDESFTHIPIMKKTDDINLDFFKNLLAETIKEQKDIVIFDRLYLTQAFRSKSNLGDYEQIEEILSPLNAMTVFLEIDEDAIADRVTKAIAHRDPTWGEYVHTKGKTMEEIATYYINQQRAQLELIKQSKLPYKVFNTTDHNYSDAVSYLIDFLEV